MILPEKTPRYGLRRALLALALLAFPFSALASVSSLVPPTSPSLVLPSVPLVFPDDTAESLTKGLAGHTTLAEGVPDHTALPDTYAAMLEDNNHTLCMAVALYYEARGEEDIGQRMVASIILNRAGTPGRWGDTICAVVSPTQFTFYIGDDCLSGGPCVLPPIHEPDAWEHSVLLARIMLHEGPLSHLQNADHYHIVGVNPQWAATMTLLDTIGNHRVYADPESQRLIAHFSAKNIIVAYGSPRPQPRP